MPSAEALAACDFTDAVEVIAANDVSRLVTVDSLPVYFSCSVSQHCENGQKLVVTAMEDVKTVDWRLYSNVADQRMTAAVGDVLKFNWENAHNVYLMASKEAFETCNFAGATEVSAVSGVTVPVESLPLYFSCSISAHCQGGQKLAVTAAAEAKTIDWKLYDRLEDRATVAKVGDVLAFEWQGGHNVYKMPSAEALAACDFTDAVEVIAANDVSRLVTVDSLPVYFSCSVSQHCENGQKLVVTAMEDVKTVDWRLYSNVADQRMTAAVGDVLKFNWENAHNVYLMASKEAFETCNFAGATEVSAVSGVTVPVESLPLYFSCSISAHCQGGQKLAVTGPAQPKTIELQWRSLLTDQALPKEGLADVGDRMKFIWSGGHNVYKMASEQAWNACDFSSAELVSDNSPALYTLTELPAFFACKVGSHCTMGQKYAVRSKGEAKAALVEALGKIDVKVRVGPFQSFDRECASYLKDVVAVDWRMYREQSEKMVSASTGNKLLFQWEGVHNVYKMPSAQALEACDFTDAEQVGTDASPVVYNADSFPLYFSCSITGHCQGGQKLTVRELVPPCSELSCSDAAGERCIEGHGCVTIPSDIQEGESCGACFCPPAYTAGECALGLTCVHHPAIADAPGRCYPNDAICNDPCWGDDTFACCAAGETCVQEDGFGPGVCQTEAVNCDIPKAVCKRSDVCTWRGGKCHPPSDDPCVGKSAKNCRRDVTCVWANKECSTPTGPIDPCAKNNKAKACKRATGCTWSNKQCKTSSGGGGPDCANKPKNVCKQSAECTFVNVDGVKSCIAKVQESDCASKPKNVCKQSAECTFVNAGGVKSCVSANAEPVDPCAGKNAKQCRRAGQALGCTYINNECRGNNNQ